MQHNFKGTWIEQLPSELTEKICQHVTQLHMSDVHREMIHSTTYSLSLGDDIPPLNNIVIKDIIRHFHDPFYENLESYFLLLDWFAFSNYLTNDDISECLFRNSEMILHEPIDCLDSKTLIKYLAYKLLNHPVCMVNTNYYISLIKHLNYQQLLSLKRFMDENSAIQL